MPKLHRLTHADFTALKTLRRENGKFFTLAVSHSPHKKAQFACVVSKKTALRANERNLIKRRSYAAIRENLPREGFAYVFTAKSSAKEATFAEIADDVTHLFEKALAGLKRVPELQ
jgi:ribonuclease P protein component